MKKTIKVLGLSVGLDSRKPEGSQGYIGWSIIENDRNLIEENGIDEIKFKKTTGYEFVDNILMDHDNYVAFKVFKINSKKDGKELFLDLSKKYNNLYAGVSKFFDWIMISNDKSEFFTIKERQIIGANAMDYFLNKINN